VNKKLFVLLTVVSMFFVALTAVSLSDGSDAVPDVKYSGSQPYRFSGNNTYWSIYDDDSLVISSDIPVYRFVFDGFEDYEFMSDLFVYENSYVPYQWQYRSLNSPGTKVEISEFGSQYRLMFSIGYSSSYVIMSDLFSLFDLSSKDPISQVSNVVLNKFVNMEDVPVGTVLSVVSDGYYVGLQGSNCSIDAFNLTSMAFNVRHPHDYVLVPLSGVSFRYVSYVYIDDTYVVSIPSSHISFIGVDHVLMPSSDCLNFFDSDLNHITGPEYLAGKYFVGYDENHINLDPDDPESYVYYSLTYGVWVESEAPIVVDDSVSGPSLYEQLAPLIGWIIVLLVLILLAVIWFGHKIKSGSRGRGRKW
jgi:hypothetical protein